MSIDKAAVRQRLLQRTERLLEKRSAPRLAMGFIVAATAAVGFLVSAGLLALGLKLIWLRYVIAAGGAYLSFLLFVRIWLANARRQWEPDVNPLDVIDLADSASEAYGPSDPGGSGGDFSAPLDVDVSAEGCLVVVLGVAALSALALTAGYVVLTAPAFFAEVLLDGVLSYGLYRRIRHLERRHWLESVFDRTIAPFVCVVLFLAAAGFAMNEYLPSADSIGDVWERLAS